MSQKPEFRVAKKKKKRLEIRRESLEKKGLREGAEIFI